MSTKFAINKKFTKSAVLFLQRLVSELLETQRTLPLSRHPPARIGHSEPLEYSMPRHDAVPDFLHAKAKKKRQTSMKIQYEYDLLTARLNLMNILPRTPMIRSMARSACLSWIRKSCAYKIFVIFTFGNLRKCKKRATISSPDSEMTHILLIVTPIRTTIWMAQ